MLRKWLLPMLATAVLAGCATDYNYRGGNGDYYYGQPRVEYRNLDPGGYYGGIGYGYGYGGFSATYFYDRFGRLVYGYPDGYYGSVYYGNTGRYRPRSYYDHREHGEHNDHDADDGATNSNRDRPAPWRDLGGLQQRVEDNADTRYRSRNERPNAVRRAPTIPMQSPPPRADAPVYRERRESSSRMGEFIGGAARGRGKRTAPPGE